MRPEELYLTDIDVPELRRKVAEILAKEYADD